MPLDLSSLDPNKAITAIYIGYYDRAPDAEGLEFWLGRYNEFLDGAADGDAGRSLSGIAERFSAAIETRDKYPYFEAPNVADARDFLTSVYQNLFNRDPDTAGLDHWATKLVTGQIPVGEIIIRIIQGAQDNGPGFNDRQTVLNKIEVGCDWVESAANEGITTSSNPMARVVDGELVILDQEAYASATSILAVRDEDGNFIDGVTDEAQSVTDGLARVDAFIAGYGNDAPDAGPDAETVAEDGVLSDFVSATDPDGDALAYSIAPGDGPDNGTLVMNADGTYTYTPNANYVGSDSFTYTVTDPSGATDKDTVSLTVENTNDAPVASGVIATTNEDTGVTITPSFTDLDNAQGAADTATISIGSNPAHGSVVVNANGTISYTPDADYFGTDSFQYIVTDAAGASSIATATVTVNAVNDAPVAADAAANATEGGAVVAGTVTATDVDGPSLSFSLNNPAPAGLSFNPNGSFTFNPADQAYNSLAAGQTQTINVAFTATDGSATDGGLLVITVTGTNDAPTASAVTATGAEDGGAITVTAITSDVDAGDTATFSIGSNPANGTVVNNGNGTFSYTPNANFNGVDSFQYIVTDSQGASAIATATITVSAVNDAPVSADVVVSSLEDQVVTGQLAATDVDGDQLTFAQAAGGDLKGGSLSLNGNGSYTYTPAADFNGTATFNYTVSDGNGGSATHSVTINIAPVADIFTVGVDNLNGGDGDDTFLGNEATLNAGDKAVGGAGNDTVIISVDTGADPAAQNLAFAGFELDVETFRTTVDGDGSATFDMSSSEITGNTFHVFNSTADSIFNRVNMTPDGDGERGNGDDNNDGIGDDELNIYLDNVTENADVTFTTRPAQVSGNADEVNIVAHNRDSNGFIGDVNFFGTPGDTEATNTSAAIEVVDISTAGSPLSVNIEDLNIPGANTLEVHTDSTSNAGNLTIGDNQAGAGLTVNSGVGVESITGFDNQLDNSIRTITGTGGNTNGSGGVALWTGNSGVTGSFGEGADTILGGSAGDNLSGNGGNDALDGAGGNDLLNGGDGNDTLLGNIGNDTINGDAGNDVMRGGAGNDSQFGGTGNDNIDTGALTDGAGTEFVDAGADNDAVATRGEFLTGRFTGQDLDPFDNPDDPSDSDGVDQFDGGTGIDSMAINGSNSAPQGQQGLNDVQNFQDIFLNSGTFNFTIDNNSVFEGDHDARVAAGGAEGETTINATSSNQATVNASTLDQAIELIGGDGNDVLFGGRGNDTIEGDGDTGTNSGGADDLRGGAGDDTFVTSASEMTGTDTMEGGSGNDTILITNDNGRTSGLAGSSGNAAVVSGLVAGIQTIKVEDTSSGDEGDLTINFNSFDNVSNVNVVHDGIGDGSTEGRVHVDGSDMDAGENLTVNMAGNTFDTDIRVTGGAGNDTFNMGEFLSGPNATSPAGDALDGGAGFDTVQITGSQSGDFTNVSNIECIEITGATNGETFTFGADAEAAFAAGVTPIIKLNNLPGVNVTIDTTAFAGPVIIEDNSSSNTFNTGPGDDTIVASTGTDTYNTDGGADVIRVSGNDLDITDSVNTGSGIDTVEMDNSSAQVNAVSNLDTNSTVENYRLTDDGDRLIGNDLDNNTLEFQNGNVNTLTEINVDFTALTDNQDTARVTLNANQQDVDFAFNVEGSSTSDTFEKRNDGVDNNIDFDGNDGNDNFILNGGDAGSTTEYSGGDGFDSVTLSGGQITDDGFVNFDTIENLQAEAGQVVNARLGTEADQSGLQQIAGSDGNDDVVADSQFNNDMTVITGPGDDRFDFGDTSGSITFVARAGEVDAADDLQGGTGTGDEIRLTADNNTADLSNTEAVETVTVVENGDASIGITITNNTFTGVADNEIDVDASDLDDTGTALPEGGLTLNAGTVTGGRILDVVGGTGADNITTGTGNDTVSSGAGNDTVVANGGNDTVLLGAGNDTASLGSGNDNATGDAGNDNIDAGIGADTVDGGANNDTITGGQGIDELTGGSGNDRFRYVDVEDSFSLSRDIITDFVEADDCIVIETQLIANAIADFNAANPGNTVPANIGLGIGAGESTVGFNNAGLFINGQGNVGPGYAVNFSDAQGAISQTARDGVADYILERNAGPNGENKLWVDANDDGVLNGLDLQIFLNVATLSTQSAVYMIDTIAPTISDVTLSTSEVRTLVNIVSGDFDNNAATADTQSLYDSISAGDTTFEGTLDGIDTDGGTVIYENVNGFTPVAGVITVVGTYGTLTVQANGAYTYQVGATAAQRSAIEALDDSEQASDNFTVNIDDGSGNKASASFTVDVNGADDHPTVVTGGATANYVEDAANAPLNGTIVGNDVDTSDTVVYNAIGGTYNSVADTWTVVGTYGTLVLDQNTGAYTYTPEATAAQQAAVQALAEGQPASDVFTVDLFDGDDAGATTTQITANWTGVNDRPDITVVTTASGDLVENDPTPVATGTLNVVDIDTTDVVALSVGPVAISGTGAAAAATALFDGTSVQLTLNTAAAAANAPAGTEFDWEFNGLLEEFDFLDDGEVLTLTYTVTADDQSGTGTATDTQDIVIRIEGTNDGPTIGVVAAGDSNAEALVEDVPNAPVTGTLTTVDLDVSDSIQSVTVTALDDTGTFAGSIAGTAGMLTAAPTTPPLPIAADTGDTSNVTWTFDPAGEQFDALAVGETLILNYRITVTDNDGLTATETVSITITGTNDAPFIVAGATDAIGAVKEIDDLAAGEGVATLTDNGTITYDDLDLSDTHTISASALTVTGSTGVPFEGPGDAVVDTPIGNINFVHNDAKDTIGWTYSVNDAATEFLGEGELLTMTSTVTIDDGNGGTTTQVVTITVEGENDAPIFTSVTAGPGKITEIVDGGAGEGTATLTTTGIVDFLDLDLSDGHTLVASAPSLGIGSITSIVSAPFPNSDHNGGFNGDLNIYTYSVNDADIEFLAEGEVLTQTVTFTVTDDEGATDTAVATITIVGSNDQPDVNAGGSGDSDAVTLIENAANPLTATDTLSVEDLDDTDTVTAAVSASSVNAGSTYLTNGGTKVFNPAGLLTITPGPVAADKGDTGNLTWTFDAGGETFEELAKDETLIFDYSIKVTDDSGIGASNTDTHVVTVTIKGTNDAPEFDVDLVAGDDVSEKVVEGDLPLTASGTVSIDDIDENDQVTVTVTKAEVDGNYVPNGVGNGTTDSTPSAAQLISMMTITGSPAAADGADSEIGWDWDSSKLPTNFDYLGNNETQTITYTLTGDDGNGGTDTQTVTIEINGTNDENTLVFETGGTGTTSATVVIEEDKVDTAAATFTFTASDVDDNDQMTLSTTGVQILVNGVAYAGPSTLPTDAALLAALDVYNTKDSSGDSVVDDNGQTGNVTAEFNTAGQLATTDFDFLGENDTATITYTIRIDDLQGATSTETITIKIDGQNDAPVFVAGSLTAESGGANSFQFTLLDVDDGAQLALVNDIPQTGGVETTLGSINNGTPNVFDWGSFAGGVDVTNLIGVDEFGAQTVTDDAGTPLPDAPTFGIHIVAQDFGGGDDNVININAGSATTIVADGKGGDDTFQISGTNDPSANKYLFGEADDGAGNNFVFQDQAAFGANIILGDFGSNEQIIFDIPAISAGVASIGTGAILGTAKVDPSGVTLAAVTVSATATATATASFTGTGFGFFQNLFQGATVTTTANATAKTTNVTTLTTLIITATASVTNTGASSAVLNVVTTGAGTAQLTFANAQVGVSAAMILDNGGAGFASLAALKANITANTAATNAPAVAFGIVNDGAGNGILHAIAIQNDGVAGITAGELTGTVTIATILGNTDLGTNDIAFV